MNPDEDDDRTVIRPPSARTRAANAASAATSIDSPTALPTAPPTALAGAFANPSPGVPTEVLSIGIDALPPTKVATVASVPPTGGPTTATTSQHTLTLPAGIRIAEFEVTQTIGEGGFGIVYLAWDHSLQRKVALKEYMPSSIATRLGQTDIKPRSERHQETFDAGMKSFINEARLLAQFDHASLLKVYRFWEGNGTAYMVMPFLEGATLRDTVRGFAEPPGEAWIVALLAPLFDALAMLHAAQCYHRDIAPDNILLLADSGRPLLLDFGAARRVIGEATQALTAILKPGYAPVEQYAEIPGLKQGPWTDIYALAAVVHWMVTGKTPSPSVGRLFDDSHVPLAQRAAGKYSPHFLEAVDRALAVMPEHRTQTVEAFRNELTGGAPPPIGQLQAFAPPAAAGGARAAGGPPTQVQRATLPPRTVADARTTVRHQPPTGAAAQVAPARSRGTLWLAIGAVLVVAAAAGGYAFWPRPSSVAASGPSVLPTTTTTPPPSAGINVPATTVPSTGTLQTGLPTVSLPAASGAAATTTDPTTTTASPSTSPVVSTQSTPVATPPVHVEPPKTAAVQDKPVGRKPPATRPDRADHADTTVAQPKPAADDNKAECARVFQRLSMGDADPTLTERVRVLRCR